ncbi:bifunctional proline dehydrogenase/L-glutamate gamma-semialdehyde dehydrogenase [Paeniglutamicibacter sulfureus]|uniref:L-glutamate gamma-semialdehyde dehydrogenase n=1 Tax=Paeniglutamicibacter sulfureus TaxID=43666 RepID=A0ABU2BL45_9MICC|nr:bifunctional proline dehydrogenase/L-glutamate gamma-semialdehyde dehydrogenase [Paeniglutamicibacter sulfureus]MDR7359343.1 RHH-type proline utilization regulon transcriptional repressor/proline dehydrogenase/delta 1-pyrroline-5-carboxylate dehydrogenase [Paeniglutamicibacter sulfureus]
MSQSTSHVRVVPPALAADGTPLVRPQDLADETIKLVRHWLTEGSKVPVDASAAQLAGVLKDPNGLDFTVGFVDGVIRPEDLKVAARNLKSLAPKVPSFLPWYMKSAVALGGTMAPIMPGIVVPIARKVLREMVGHLIIDATDAKLGASISKIKKEGIDLNVNLLGEAILGEGEAARRLEGTHKLLARDDVDYVSIKVSSTVAPHNHWAFDEAVEHIIEKLIPLYRLAVTSAPKKKFINLDMEEYKDLDLTIAVFTKILDREEFRDLEAGIVLQAYLPDALSAMIHLQEWSAKRVGLGGAPIKVRVVKGANLPMEQVEANLHGWPVATWNTKQDSDTSYKSVLDYALRPGHVENVRIGIAGHNLFDVALAWLLAQGRSVTAGIEFEMLLGMATGQAEAVRKDVGRLLLYTPVVHPGEFDVAIAYLIRRLEEGASQENFMSAVFELDKNEALFEREKNRFLASLADLDDSIPAPHRIQDRNVVDAAAVEAKLAGLADGTLDFENTPDTDPDLPGNRAWGREIVNKMVGSTLGVDSVAKAMIHTEDELNTVVETAVSASESWQAMGAKARAAILHRAGAALEARRADLLEVMGSECGKTLDQGDPEVSEAIDFAHYYAQRGLELYTIDGATFVPSKLTVVTPPWNFPVAIPAGSTLSALAAGSSVIIKPAGQAARSGAVMVEALWEAGVPRDVLQLVQLSERDLGTELVSHPAVDRLILTGGYETAQLFRSFRKDLPLLAETSGKNAVIVTPNADLDLAAKDVAASAFGHAGQKCSAASLVILVGSAADSKRFHNQLIDDIRSLKVGYPQDPQTQMGPVIEPAQGKLLRGLTTLGEGEKWVLEPQKLDESGKLWSPGVRSGVKRGSEYHLTEYFGPILGVMTAETLEEAVSIVNDIDYGLTSGLHSLDSGEMAYWLENIQAGNLYINRGITGAIVQRQPFGGWKKSAIGAGTKAGGPNYLVGMGSWEDAPVAQAGQLSATSTALLNAARGTDIAEADLSWLEGALASDNAVWTTEFNTAKDVSGLHAERNVFRYRALPVTIRFENETSGHGIAELLRVVAAGIAAGSRVTVSSAVEIPSAIRTVLAESSATVVVEDAQAFGARAARLAAKTGPDSAARIRLIGGSVLDVAEATGGKPDVAIYGNNVVSAGRVEMLTFLHEQAVSITAHRFGTPNHLSDAVI